MSMMATHLMATHLMATEWVSMDGLGDRAWLAAMNRRAIPICPQHLTCNALSTRTRLERDLAFNLFPPHASCHLSLILQ